MAANTSVNKVYVDLVDRLVSEGGFKQISSSMDKFERQGKKTKGMANSLTETFEKKLPRGLKEVTKTTLGTTAAGKDYVKTSSEIARADNRVNMNHLGVMFAGMALQRSMSGLNSTAREWVGMNELMSTAMGVTMLPATMDLLELGVLPLFNSLTSLPPEAQKAIGYVSVALEGLGGMMMTGGQLMLGIHSFSEVMKDMSISLPTAFSNMGSTLQKAFNSKFAKGVGITGSIMFAASDILFDEENDFEWDKKLGAGAFAAMATKGGLAAKATGGVVAIAILAAIEIAMDPEGYGKSVANFGNYFQKIVDMAADGKDWMVDSIKAIFSDAERPEMPESFTEWGQDFDKGFSNQMQELGESGELSSGKQKSYNELSKYMDSQSGYGNMTIGQVMGTYNNEKSSINNTNDNTPSEGIVFSPTYNVNVSDKAEFKKILEVNNTKMTSEVLRAVKINGS